jgi:hypothetical protein
MEFNWRSGLLWAVGGVIVWELFGRRAVARVQDFIDPYDAAKGEPVDGFTHEPVYINNGSASYKPPAPEMLSTNPYQRTM